VLAILKLKVSALGSPGYTGVPVSRPQITELEPDTVRLQWSRVDIPAFSHEQDPLTYMIEMQVSLAREHTSFYVHPTLSHATTT
jgi:hypothetical protein